ncbi:hypothetical protein U1701_09565 [Sphingomonas sp. PB2P19]|uniref:hypothetical protein n=1 Tax=Sphingomonas rhamnosi TaxID=3096156 RepID=UPI002FC97664
MDVSTTPVAERIARVLAGQRISVNAGGDEESAAAHVDSVWVEYLPDAIAVLKTLREPDRAMAAAGDPAVWEAMVLAGIRGATPRTVVL